MENLVNIIKIITPLNQLSNILNTRTSNKILTCITGFGIYKLYIMITDLQKNIIETQKKNKQELKIIENLIKDNFIENIQENYKNCSDLQNINIKMDEKIKNIQNSLLNIEKYIYEMKNNTINENVRKKILDSINILNDKN